MNRQIELLIERAEIGETWAGKVLEQIIQKNNAEEIFTLAWYYYQQREYIQADKYFRMAPLN